MLEVRDEAAAMAPVATPVQWTSESAAAIYRLPFNDLLFRAQVVHREHFDPNRVQLSRLLNIKTGGCPEDCGYCSQSSHHTTGLAASKLIDVETIIAEARKAKAGGATRYCMGAAWRNPKPRDMDAVVEILGETMCHRSSSGSEEKSILFGHAGKAGDTGMWSSVIERK